jgi:hypothetical protein
VFLWLKTLFYSLKVFISFFSNEFLMIFEFVNDSCCGSHFGDQDSWLQQQCCTDQQMEFDTNQLLSIEPSYICAVSVKND